MERCKKDILPFPYRILCELFIPLISVLGEQIKVGLAHGLIIVEKYGPYPFQSFYRVVSPGALAMTIRPVIVPGRKYKWILKFLKIRIHLLINFVRARTASSFYVTYMNRKGRVFLVNRGGQSLKFFIIIRDIIRHITDGEEAKIVSRGTARIQGQQQDNNNEWIGFLYHFRLCFIIKLLIN